MAAVGLDPAATACKGSWHFEQRTPPISFLIDQVAVPDLAALDARLQIPVAPRP
ncbi:MAG TPA: hypothetical protein VLF71_05005 [Candidatus Saccharimonadales bacterium]|nr:hypothetical protein [Candidatus Saccharimonadales bacterium]